MRRPSPRTAPASCAIAAALLALSPDPFPGWSPTARLAPARQSVESRNRVDARRLMEDVRALTAPQMEGRLPATAGSRRARRFILDRFRSLRLDPVNGSYLHSFPFRGVRGTARQTWQGSNLLAMAAGRVEPRQFVIVSAHYDHLGIRNGSLHPGADDNASGVAALLAIARWFAREPPARSVLFAAFDAEEQGLRGSRAFVGDPPIDLRRVVAVVNMDMLARGDDNRLVIAGTYHYPDLKPAAEAAARGRRLAVTFGHDRPPADAPGVEDWTRLSDHGPFHDAGVPFLYFGVDYHADYHKPTDTADRIPVAFFTEATEVVLDTISRLAGGSSDGRK